MIEKPLEFKIEEKNTKEGTTYSIIFYYYNENSNKYITQEYEIGWVPSGIELNKHYSIGDLYGYRVVDDKKEEEK